MPKRSHLGADSLFSFHGDPNNCLPVLACPPLVMASTTLKYFNKLKCATCFFRSQINTAYTDKKNNIYLCFLSYLCGGSLLQWASFCLPPSDHSPPLYRSISVTLCLSVSSLSLYISVCPSAIGLFALCAADLLIGLRLVMALQPLRISMASAATNVTFLNVRFLTLSPE